MSKWLSYVSWLLLFQLVLSVICLYGFFKIDFMNQQKEIAMYQKEGNTLNEENQDYFGYIRFPEYHIERLIKYGDPDQAINEAYIGIFGAVPSHYPKDSLVLVGHSRMNQFEVLHSLKQGAQIEIIKRDTRYQYQVRKKEMIQATDLSFLEQITPNQLILITCFDDSSKRLLVIGNLIKTSSSN